VIITIKILIVPKCPIWVSLSERCPYCDHSLEEVEKSNEIALHLEDKHGKSSSFSIFEKFTQASIKPEKQNTVMYILIGCITLPFIAIIALLFLRVFFMFFEIFSI
jgi:hypothetical protein